MCLIKNTIGLLLAVAVVCPAQVTFVEYAVPTSGSRPYGITTGPDGNLWFTELSGNKVGKITTSGAITEFSIPTAASGPTYITTGPDGNLWFTEGSFYGRKIGRITPAGVITEFPIPSGDSLPYGITAGPDGNLWFTENTGHILPGNYIGRITTSGTITEFPLARGGSTAPAQITAGPDGNLWFADNAGNQIAATSGITAGPDGNIWFTEATGIIGRITPAGVITEFPFLSSGASPEDITTGPDGNLWITGLTTIVKATILAPPPSGITVHPATGGNAGSVTVQILGNGFQSGLTAKLTGLGPDIIGSNTAINSASAFILTTTFDLTGATPGVRNVVVTNPDGTTATLTGGFTVEQGGAPQISLNISGRNVIRIGTAQPFYIWYRNSGNVDALGAHLIVTFPSSVASSLGFGNEVGVVSTGALGANTVVTVDLGRVPAGSGSVILMFLTASSSQTPFTIQTSIRGR